MAQIFHPSTNTLSKLSIFGALFVLAGAAWVLAEVNRSSYVTEVGVAHEQPVPFSHKHHVSGMGIDCRYCHTAVETSAAAGIPPTQTCISCHSEVWAQSPMLEPVRESWRSDRSIAWTRVHDLPDFVYFDHRIHVAKGVGCVSCHGRVDEMPLMWAEKSLQMAWCLECHRHPEPNLRPPEAVFAMDWSPQPLAPSPAAAPPKVEHRLACYACHR